MGNETSGFAVLNLSGYTMHMGLSMAATHYYENNVHHGEIFYRWPGAVHYTVYAQITPEISDEICAKEIKRASLIGITCAGVAATAVISVPLSVLTAATAATAGAATVANDQVKKKILDVFSKVNAADLYAKKKGCYGGGSGTWLVLRGGPKRVNGHVTHEKLRLVKEKPEYILANGEFTSYSRTKFYTTAESRKHIAAGHCCRRAACNLVS